jgi:DNA-binding LytR/AlgR family response regulator
MSIYNVLIGEDDVIISEYLASILAEMGHHVCAIVSNYGEAQQFLENNELPHLALLDIRMHNRDQGIEIAAEMRSRNIPFIFITSFTDKNTLQKAIEQQPFGYIVKPFKKEEVRNAVNKVLMLLRPDHIMLKDGATYTRILFDEVLFLKSDNVYVEVCTTNKTHLVRAQLSEILKEFPAEQFVRVHRSYAVNTNKISRYGPSKIFIDDLEIPVSKAYANELKRHLP